MTIRTQESYFVTRSIKALNPLFVAGTEQSLQAARTIIDLGSQMAAKEILRNRYVYPD